MGYHAYNYDAYGNRATTFLAGGTPSVDIPTSTAQYSTSSNRLVTSVNGGPVDIGYDGAGNMTSHPITGTLAYDSEGRVVQSVRNGVMTAYLYDGEGRRIRKTSGAASRFYLYDAFGNLAAEYATQSSGPAGGTQYLVSDALGSTRLILDQAGNCVERMDYYPFGTVIPATAATGRNTLPCYGSSAAQNSLMFTGKERDAETGLDYFGARYMSAAQGRFTSPDPHNIIMEASSEEEFASFLSNPQNWNRYAYVTNNPLSITDPDGRCPACLMWAQQALQAASRYGSQASQAVSRWGSQASQAAQRYGQQAYVWATQFFNSPAGQEAIQTGAELVTGASAGPGSIAGTEARIVANAAKGKAGEVLADIVKNTERIPSASGTAAYRIPDILDHANKVIGDVKNFSSKLSMFEPAQRLHFLREGQGLHGHLAGSRPQQGEQAAAERDRRSRRANRADSIGIKDICEH